MTSNLIYIEWELDNQQKLIYMKKNHYGKNGSHIEPFLQKELPILSSLKFIKPFQINGLNRTWSLSQYWRKLGVYVIKDEQKERIIIIGNAKYCLYKAITRCIRKLIRLGNNNCTVAVIPSKKKEIPKILNLLRNEIKKIPINDEYQKIEIFFKNKKTLPIEVLDFRSPYAYKNGKRICTFSKASYNVRGGTYIIRENENVVYVGMSVKWLYQAMYNHFSPYQLDRHSQHYRVEYSETLDKYDYTVALIEVPAIGRSEKCFKEEVFSFEKYLIKQLNPRDNIKEVEEEEQLVPEPIPVPDEDPPF